MIEVRCFNSLAEAAFLRDDINTLNSRSAHPDPFSTFEFFENFFCHDELFPAGRGLHLWFLTAFSEGQLVGYLALKQVMHEVMWMHIPTLGFFVMHDTDRPHLVAKFELVQQVSEAFYVYLLGRRQEWTFLEFQQQDNTSLLFPPPVAVSLKGYRVRQWPSLENGTIHVRWSSLREYFGALSRKFRSNVSRQIRTLLASGNVEWLASSDPAATPALFELYRSIEPHSWKSKMNVNIGRHPERVEYVRGLLDVHQPMRISIHVLLLDGVPIAGLINGAFMKGLYALHIVYDERQSRLAPGLAMLLMGMRQAIDGGFASFNLLSGFGYYKSRWLAEITETRIAQIYRVGGYLFWHRVFGDWRRQLFSFGKKVKPLLFNPQHRVAHEQREGEKPSRQRPEISSGAAERAHVAVLVANARKGSGEFLSAMELAALMPFETQRPPMAVAKLQS